MSNINIIKPADIEKKSFEIIGGELKKMGISLPPAYAPIIKRVIHTTADFDYAGNLYFSPDVVYIIQNAIKAKTPIITDTQMAKSGINKTALAKYGSEVHCFMSDEDVAERAKEAGVTRAYVSMDKSLTLGDNLIYAIGNAPTALIRLHELIGESKCRPAAIIGVPVGFVNVVEAKELIMGTDIPYIVARGRKGGSNVAAAIINAILYSFEGENA
ncbi:MAG: precorrin-8X methylmutase [Lachnospiraceae bacterium]|nr:precorrin-8X methylmutase [Lachnospiraceae bacterium]